MPDLTPSFYETGVLLLVLGAVPFVGLLILNIYDKIRDWKDNRGRWQP